MPGHRVFFTALVVVMVVSLLGGCTLTLPGSTSPTPTTGLPPEPTAAPVPQAEINFTVRIPGDTPTGQGISLDLLDEVTGLALNATQNLMSPVQSGVYTVKLVAPVGSVLKYRYSRVSSPPAIEYTAAGKQVRYRMLYVTGPSQVEDQVSAWTDLRYAGTTGRIQGDIKDITTNAPIGGLLVEAGGVTTYTSADGSFLLEGLPPGNHTLFAYSLDGSYKPFQQGAVVGADATTPAPLRLEPIGTIKVTFNVQVPASTLSPLPIRLIGNLYSLGNTFTDLQGGLSTLANRAPVMTPLPDGRYTLSLNLPVGYNLQYKYTLGDGFWNAEHTTNGQFRVRNVILPAQDTTFNDVVAAWQAPNSSPVNFTVTVPENTPAGDYVSIQFSPFGWTEPIPMWSMGKNRWVYVLYSPLNMLGNVGYRYCRNDACGAADDVATAGATAQGWPFSSSLIPQSFQDTVEHWSWWQPSGQPTTVVATDIQSRGSGFIAGIEMQAKYQPAWQAAMGNGIQNIKDLGANWVFFSPTWHFTRNTPPVLEPVNGQDMLNQDLLTQLALAQQRSLMTGIHAQTVIDGDAAKWWADAQKDANWWANWFARYRTFALNFADLAASRSAGALILGDENMLPAYPGGTLSDGNSSNVPASAEQQWRDLIQEVRQRYKGLLIWSLPAPAALTNMPSFLDQVDLISVTLDYPLTDINTASQADLTNTISAILDSEIKPIQERFGKSILVSFRYSSSDGSARGCALINEACFSFATLDEPEQASTQNATLDLQEQVDLYNAAMVSVSPRTWIGGFISSGYFSPAALQDKSSSIHGKPASDIIWYWYHKLLE